jgi:hypothetical protein
MLDVQRRCLKPIGRGSQGSQPRHFRPSHSAGSYYGYDLDLGFQVSKLTNTGLISFSLFSSTPDFLCSAIDQG